MKKNILAILLVFFLFSGGIAQIVLLNEDFGATGSFASPTGNPPSAYDLDPVAFYLPTESIVINYYGQNLTSVGKYEGASGGNFFLLSNNWNLSGVILSWANMDVSAFSELDQILFGCAFSGGANAAWTGNWLFSLEYSFDDVVNDPAAATWYGIDLLAKASGWPDPMVAGGANWSQVTVNAGVNLLGKDLLSLRIRSNGNFDYHFDDLKLIVKTPSSGMERVSIAKETFGPSGFYRGPANDYDKYSSAGALSFNNYQVHFQNYGNTFNNTYEGNSHAGNWWISDNDVDGVKEDTLVFSLNTTQYADVQLQFGFAYWGGIPGSMVGVYFTTDSITWYPLRTVSPTTPYPGTNQLRISDGYFHLIKYDDILPRAEKLTIKIFQATEALFVLDDIELTGVYQPLSADASLSSIFFPNNEGLTLIPEFSEDITSYFVLLPRGTKATPMMEATTTYTEAQYLVEAALDVTSGYEPDRQSYIYVTASDGETTLLYTITFNIALNDDAHLSGLTVNGFPVADFDPATFIYTIILPSGTTQVPAVDGTKSDANAGVVVIAASSIPGATIVKVTAEDGVTIQDYALNFSLAPVSIEPGKSKLGLKIFPVPAGNILNIESSGGVERIKIRDVTGKIISETVIISMQVVQVNTSSLKNGLYFLEVYNLKGERMVARFLRQ